MPEKNKTAVMCHNIAKYNREHQQPDLIPQERFNRSADILSEMQMNTPDDDEIIALEDGVDALRAIAAGEYKQVVHAVPRKIKPTDPKALFEKQCPECDSLLFATDNFCPNCGAIMVEEEEK